MPLDSEFDPTENLFAAKREEEAIRAFVEYLVRRTDEEEVEAAESDGLHIGGGSEDTLCLHNVQGIQRGPNYHPPCRLDLSFTATRAAARNLHTRPERTSVMKGTVPSGKSGGNPVGGTPQPLTTHRPDMAATPSQAITPQPEHSDAVNNPTRLRTPPPPPPPPPLPPLPTFTRPSTGISTTNKGRPTRNRNRSRARTPTPPPSTAPLTPETLKFLLDTFDNALSHTHYAVCGHAALMVWGYRSSHMPSHVSIVCPAEDKQVILSRARAAGWYVYPKDDPKKAGRGEMIGVPVSGSATTSETVMAFKLRTVENPEVWARLGRVRPLALEPPYVGSLRDMMRTAAQVIEVPTLLDQFARAWYLCTVKGEAGSGGGGRQEPYIAGLILWLLQQLARDAGECSVAEGRWKLTAENVPCVVYEKFRHAFAGRYPKAVELLEACGLPTPAHVAAHEEANGAALEARADRLDAFDPDAYRMRIARGEGISRSATHPTVSRPDTLTRAYRDLEFELFNFI